METEKELEVQEPMDNTEEPEVQTVPEAEVPIKEPEEPKASQSTEELEQLKAEKIRLEEGYKGLQRKLNQVNTELSKRSASEARLDTLEQTQRILVGMLQERENINVDDIPEKQKVDYLKKFDDVIAEQKRKVQQEEYTAKVRDYQQRTDALKLDENSEEYLDIKELVLEGKFQRADIKLAKMEAKVKENPVKEDKAEPRKETDDEIFERIARQKGLLKTDTAVPAGKVSSFEDAEERFSRGEISMKEYSEARNKAGIY